MSFCRRSPSILVSSTSASLRFWRPSVWIFITSSRVEIKSSLVLRRVSMSTTPRSASLAVAMVPILSISAFLRSSSLVMLVTAL